MSIPYCRARGALDEAVVKIYGPSHPTTVKWFTLPDDVAPRLKALLETDV